MSNGHDARVKQVAVIGGSSTGLLAAAALAGPRRDVVVVERDEFPPDPTPRPGVPQGHQAHVFLYRGLLAAEELLPGLREDLLAEGALPVNAGHVLALTELGWMPQRHSPYEILSCTRPLLEHVVRRRVLELPHVSVRQGVRVQGLARREAPGEPDRWTVQLADSSRSGAGRSDLDVDLVVDASGRSTRMPHWLAELGVPVPEPTIIDAQVGYATRLYRARPSLDADFPGVMIGATKETLRGALALPAENGLWMIATIGLGDRRPPRDNAGFEHFLNQLADPAIADLVAHCDPVTDAQIHRQTSNIRHPYERVLHWPDGLLAAGDALCAFDPVYGQGITVGAIQALQLRRAAQRGLRPSGAGRLQRQLVGVVNTPWAIATAADMSFPTSDAQLSLLQRVLGVWGEEVAGLVISGDERANESLNRVYNLMDSPLVLMHPRLVASAARARVFGRAPAARRPSVLDELAPDRLFDSSRVSASG